jgi:hypothetical protein
MEKFRIVQLVHDSGTSGRKIEWVIEQKNFWGWRQIYRNEGPRKIEVTHSSYDEAEQYLLKNYTGHGICKRYGNLYTYEHYSYNY